MGYNGSNRRGYDVRYRGFKKSSASPANRLLKGVTLLGFLGASKLFENTPSASEIVSGLAISKKENVSDVSAKQLSEKGATLIIGILLASVPIFQLLCYLTYQNGWWPFFSFLVFGTLAFICLFVSEGILEGVAQISPKKRKVLFWAYICMTVANIGLSLWPFWLVESDVFVFVHFLVIIEAVLCLAPIYNLYNSNYWGYSEMIKREEQSRQ